MKQYTGDHLPHVRGKMLRSRRESERSLAHIELLRDDEPELPRRARGAILADAVKRVVDLLGSLLLIVALSPVLLVIAIAIRIDRLVRSFSRIAAWGGMDGTSTA
jgi:lipopolysaccharide/colanic/teichoic acid biosynthesis glycosyltransferase